MARIAALASLFFVGVMLLIPVLDDGDYAAGTDSISEGALVGVGWLQTAAFLVLGVASVLLAYVLRGAWRGRSGKAAPALIAVWGVAVVLCGIFRVDEGAEGKTTAAAIHLMAALVAFAALVIAMWFASFAFRSNEAWASWSTASIAASAVATAAFVLLGATPQDASWGGYVQRGFTVIVLAWLTAVALIADGRGRSRRDDATNLTARAS